MEKLKIPNYVENMTFWSQILKGDSDENGIFWLKFWLFCQYLPTKHCPKCIFWFNETKIRARKCVFDMIVKVEKKSEWPFISTDFRKEYFTYL